MTGAQFIKKTGIDDDTYFTIFDPKLFTIAGFRVVMDYILNVPNAVIPILDWQHKGKTFYFVNGHPSDYAGVMHNSEAMNNEAMLLKWRQVEIGMYVNYKIPLAQKIDLIQGVCDEFRRKWNELGLKEYQGLTKDIDYIKEFDVKVNIKDCGC